MTRHDDYVLLDYGTKAPSLTVQVTDILRQRINDDIYPVGRPLPRAATLVAQFRVSNTVVKGACQTLADEGIIGKTQGQPPLVLRRSHDTAGVGDAQGRIYVLSALDEALAALSLATQKLNTVRRRYEHGRTEDNGTSTPEEKP